MYLEYPAGKPYLCMVPEVMHDLSDSDQCEFRACAMGRVNVSTITDGIRQSLFQLRSGWVIVWVSTDCQTVAYVEVMAATALLFDFCITFDSEVRWTWGRKWGIVRIAFVISRYVPILCVAMYLYYTVKSTHRGIPNPGVFIAVNGTITTLGSAAADVLLVARTYVFCGGEKRILIAISLFGTATIAAILTIISVVASKSTNPECGAWEGQQGIIYGLYMIFQLVLMFLTLYKRFKFYQMENSPIVATIYRDGVFYMLCITLLSVMDWVAILMHPLSYTRRFYGAGLQTVVRSVLASRILFNLRAANESRDVVINWSVASGMIFAQPIQTASCVDHLELWNNTDP
ncbi:hypothetical protein DFJ58DRAFT_26927 [Suillus subalutaceus]|uniref:uncharacterized protein n=1 Tax=Suillus subalutaceus TaxID=48586 RepID=UPI001B86A52F|nr:uncharacterized protein DFJ58DRAFT_26927 [Suillus subalutaceus]KAG1844508.1 hypothetical protein DFJ58DRAFT_26927 [Suillus subalutaceus]